MDEDARDEIPENWGDHRVRVCRNFIGSRFFSIFEQLVGDLGYSF